MLKGGETDDCRTTRRLNVTLSTKNDQRQAKYPPNQERDAGNEPPIFAHPFSQ